jgi:hypothetical protein
LNTTLFPEEDAMKWSKLMLLICPAFSFFPSWAVGQEASVIQVEEEALKQLQVAADSDPDNVSIQLKFAQRLFEKGKTQEAWQRLRDSYGKAPEDQGTLMGLQAVMDGYKRQGLLNVGTPENRVIELLGQPHHSRKMPWGIRHVYGMMAVDFRQDKIHELIKLLGATNELFDASHVVDVDLGITPWHVGIRQKGDGSSTAFLFPEGESIAKWNEMVTVERFVGQAEGNTMKNVLAKVQEQTKAEGAVEGLFVAQQDETTAIFGVKYPSGDGRSAKQQLVRLWMSSRDVHRLAYTHVGEIPSDQEGGKWLSVFQNAKLKPYDPSVSPTSQAFSPRNQVKNLAEAIRTDLRKASQFKPTDQALSAIAATEEGRKKLQAYCETVYNEVEHAGAPAKPNQTEIIVFGPAAEELPGGYNDTREHLKADVKFYGFKYVVPGETSGMSFDGAFEVEGNWYFLPKAYRAFR